MRVVQVLLSIKPDFFFFVIAKLCVLVIVGDLRSDEVEGSLRESPLGLSARSLTMLRGVPHILSAAEEPQSGCWVLLGHIYCFICKDKSKGLRPLKSSSLCSVRERGFSRWNILKGGRKVLFM